MINASNEEICVSF